MVAKNTCEKFELEREGADRNLRIDCVGCTYYPSVEDSEHCMEMIINKLIEIGGVTSIILSSDQNFIYPSEQAAILDELAQKYLKLEQEHEILKFPMVSAPHMQKLLLFGIMLRQYFTHPV